MNTYLRTLLVVAVATSSGILLLHPPDNVLTAIRRPHFTDISSRSNISYITNNDFQGRKYFQQPMCGGIAILDYDQDGLMDICFTNGANCFLEAHDPETGDIPWKWWSAPLKKGDTGFETWPDEYDHGGGMTWVPGTYDPALHLYYLGTANPNPVLTGRSHKGDIRIAFAHDS